MQHGHHVDATVLWPAVCWDRRSSAFLHPEPADCGSPVGRAALHIYPTVAPSVQGRYNWAFQTSVRLIKFQKLVNLRRQSIGGTGQGGQRDRQTPLKQGKSSHRQNPGRGHQSESVSAENGGSHGTWEGFGELF